MGIVVGFPLGGRGAFQGGEKILGFPPGGCAFQKGKKHPPPHRLLSLKVFAFPRSSVSSTNLVYKAGLPHSFAPTYVYLSSPSSLWTIVRIGLAHLYNVGVYGVRIFCLPLG